MAKKSNRDEPFLDNESLNAYLKRNGYKYIVAYMTHGPGWGKGYFEIDAGMYDKNIFKTKKAALAEVSRLSRSGRCEGDLRIIMVSDLDQMEKEGYQVSMPSG